MTDTTYVKAVCALLLPGAAALFAAYGTARTLWSVRRFPDDVRALEPWPRVTIVVPACNEAEHLEEATRAKLACDYPNLELVLVDDRSTDGTLAVAERLAAEDPRVQVVHVSELPAGWLGKVHALHRGVERATGEYVVLADADVHFAPTLLRRAIVTAEDRPLDFASVVPELWSNTFWLDVAIGYFLRSITVMGRVWRVADPRSRAAVGSGVFALIRRSALERTRGLPWLALEIADDVALGQMMKRAGARCAVFNARGDVKLHFYRSLGELARGLEKNGFAALGGFSLARHLLATAMILYLEVGPLVALVVPDALTRAVAALVLVVLVGTQIAVARWTDRPSWSAAVPCVGVTILLTFMLRSALLASARGSVSWRGTSYSLAALRAGRRLEYF